MQQQILPLIFADGLRLDDFIGEQAQNLLVPSLHDWARGQGPATLCLYGAPGSGRTHLLQATAQEAGGQGGRVCYLSLRDARLHPEVLEGLEQSSHVCLDDLEWVLGRADWEWALFALCNRLSASHHALLVACRELPSHACSLRDLGSRLMAGLVFRLPVLAESELRQLVWRLAQRQGLQLSDAIVDHLMAHLPRQAAVIQQSLQVIDRYALLRQRPISLHLVREALKHEPLA